MVGCDPVMTDTPHDIGNRSFVNEKSEVFLLMRPINTSYGKRADGTEFPAELALTRIDVGGSPMFTVYLRDVTDRKRADEKFRLAVESAPNAIVMVNQEGDIAMVNSQTEKLFGYHRDELIGQAADILVPNKFRDAHPRYRADFFAHLEARPMGTGQDLYGLRKDGSEFPVEIGLNPIEMDEGTWVLRRLRSVQNLNFRSCYRVCGAVRRAVRTMKENAVAPSTPLPVVSILEVGGEA